MKDLTNVSVDQFLMERLLVLAGDVRHCTQDEIDQRLREALFVILWGPKTLSQQKAIRDDYSIN